MKKQFWMAFLSIAVWMLCPLPGLAQSQVSSVPFQYIQPFDPAWPLLQQYCRPNQITLGTNMVEWQPASDLGWQDPSRTKTPVSWIDCNAYFHSTGSCSAAFSSGCGGSTGPPNIPILGTDSGGLPVLGTYTASGAGAATRTATAKLGDILSALDYAGADIGAKINAAYAASWTGGQTILVPGQSTCQAYTTPILLNTPGKPAILQGTGAGHSTIGVGGTCLYYTPTTGAAYTRDWGGSLMPGGGIRDISFVGPGPSSSTTGVLFGATFGAEGTYDLNLEVKNFGIGWNQANGNTSYTFLNDCENCQLTDNGQNALINTGENIQFHGGVVANTSPNHANCVVVSGGGSAKFISTSFDSCQLVTQGTSVTALEAPHFENPNNDTTDFIVQQDLSSIDITDILGLVHSTGPAEFITQQGGQSLTITGGTYFSAFTQTHFITIASGNPNIYVTALSDNSGNYSSSWLGGTTAGVIHLKPYPVSPYNDVDNPSSYPVVYANNIGAQVFNELDEYKGYQEVTSTYDFAMNFNPPFADHAGCQVTGKPLSSVLNVRWTTGAIGNCGLPGISCLYIGGTPSSLATPTGLSLIDLPTGGTLLPNHLYGYRVAAIDLVGSTVPEAEVSITTANDGNSTHAIALAWNLTPEAYGYDIFGRTSGAELGMTPTALLDTSFSGSTGAFTDTGAINPSGAMPVANTATGIRFSFNCIGR